MKKPLKWAITILGMLAVFAVVYICGEKFGVTAGPIPTIVLMLAVYVAGWFWTRERPKPEEDNAPEPPLLRRLLFCALFNNIMRYIALEARRERC